MDNRGNSAQPLRSTKLARLLREADTPEVLPWSRVEAIVAAAPPVRTSLFSLLVAPARPLRLATSMAALLIFATAALAVIPAEAEHVGTIISTPLPAAWQPDSVQMGEFKRAAEARFAELALPASELYVLNVAQADGRPELAVVLQNVDNATARSFYDALAQQYPALDSDSYQPRIEDVEGDSPGSLLSVALAGALRPGRMAGLSESEARLAVLTALTGMGLTPTQITTTRREDGTLVIKIDAQMEIQVEGHTQEDLDSRGLSRETLAPGDLEELLKVVR